MALGEIRMVAFDFAPRGWLLCDGRTVQRSAEPQLFSAIGTQFGGQPGTFKLPDLRDRAPISHSKDWKLGDTGSIMMGWRKNNDRDFSTVYLNFIIGTTEEDYDAPFIGEVRMFGGPAHPSGWELCNGRLLDVNPYITGYSVIRDRFAQPSDAKDQVRFRIPNLSRRVPLNSPEKLGTMWGMDGFHADPSHPASVLAVNFFICLFGGRFPQS